jgi:hypothetical protein
MKIRLFRNATPPCRCFYRVDLRLKPTNRAPEKSSRVDPGPEGRLCYLLFLVGASAITPHQCGPRRGISRGVFCCSEAVFQ